jgi:hypothetical protein
MHAKIFMKAPFIDKEIENVIGGASSAADIYAA